MVKLDPKAQENIESNFNTRFKCFSTEERIETYLRIKNETKNNDSTQPNYDAQNISKINKRYCKLEEKYGVI